MPENNSSANYPWHKIYAFVLAYNGILIILLTLLCYYFNRK